jgi:hypothetical protein
VVLVPPGAIVTTMPELVLELELVTAPEDAEVDELVGLQSPVLPFSVSLHAAKANEAEKTRPGSAQRTMLRKRGEVLVAMASTSRNWG